MRRSDVQRSVRRWLALALDDDAWSLEDERIEVEDDQRPMGYVETSTGVSVVFARSAVPQGDVQRRLTMTATLYPALDGTAQECGRRARAVVDVLTDSLAFGLIIPETPEVPLYPALLPLWSFAGLSDEQTVQGAPLAYADVDSAVIREIADPLDDRRWTVVFEARVTWWSGGRSRWGSEVEPTTTGVTIDGPHVTP